MLAPSIFGLRGAPQGPAVRPCRVTAALGHAGFGLLLAAIADANPCRYGQECRCPKSSGKAVAAMIYGPHNTGLSLHLPRYGTIMCHLSGPLQPCSGHPKVPRHPNPQGLGCAGSLHETFMASSCAAQGGGVASTYLIFSPLKTKEMAEPHRTVPNSLPSPVSTQPRGPWGASV